MCSGNNKERSVPVNTVCVRTEVLHLHPVWKGRLRREHSAVSLRPAVLVLSSTQVSSAGRTSNGGIRTLSQGSQMLWEVPGSGAARGLGHGAAIIPWRVQGLQMLWEVAGSGAARGPGHGAAIIPWRVQPFSRPESQPARGPLRPWEE